MGKRSELAPSSHVSLCPRLDRIQTPCLPNDLPGEVSGQPGQKTRLTVPDCSVKEISSLSERSYSITRLTDGGRWHHRGGSRKMRKETSARGCFYAAAACSTVKSKEAPEASQAGWSSDSSLTSRGPEVNTENDLLSPAQLKTKRRGHLTDVFFFWGCESVCCGGHS